MQELINAIGTLGFPIVACGALFWQLNKTNENHKEEVKQLTTAIENNTIALTKIAERMDDKNDQSGT